MIVERSENGSQRSVTVSHTVRERIMFITTAESIRFRLLGVQEDHLPSSDTAVVVTDRRRRV